MQNRNVDNQHESYESISWEKTNSNPSYRSLMQNMFREQAARTIQRAWRRKKKLVYKGQYSEILNGPFTMKFLKEPLGTKAEEHAEKIIQGKWLELDFDEPEFIRNIYKTLRLGKITINQMATAWLLCNAYREFKDERSTPIRQHDFNGSGPYHPENISYASRENLIAFETGLEKLNASEKCYFSINLSRKYEIAFLYDSLMDYKKLDDKLYMTYPNFFNLFKKFVKKSNIDEKRKQELSKLIDQLPREEHNANATKALTRFLLEEAPDLVSMLENRSDMSTKFRQSSRFLVTLIRLDNQNPALELSPDYREDNSESPLLCLILPTISALIELQRAFHPKDATDPFFTAGKISPRLIRACDEYNQSRPVELTHPDLKSNEMPHGAYSTDFMLLWHDLFIHCWRNSVVVNKPFIRYINELLEKQKGFYMSKAIWELCDYDFGSCQAIRKNLTYGNSSGFMRAYREHVREILSKAGINFFQALDKHDHNLILMMDMIIRGDKWSELNFGISPLDLFKDNINFQSILSKLNQLIQNNRVDKKFKPIAFYILAYRLDQHPRGNELCNLIAKIRFSHFFRWDRNGGILLQDKFGLTCNAIEKMTPDELYKTLLLTIEWLIERKIIATPSELESFKKYLADDKSKSLSVTEESIFKKSNSDPNPTSIQNKLFSLLRDENGLLLNNPAYKLSQENDGILKITLASSTPIKDERMSALKNSIQLLDIISKQENTHSTLVLTTNDRGCLLSIHFSKEASQEIISLCSRIQTFSSVKRQFVCF